MRLGSAALPDVVVFFFVLTLAALLLRILLTGLLAALTSLFQILRSGTRESLAEQRLDIVFPQ